MALNSFLKLTGQKQGDIKGSVTQKGREGQILVFAFNHEVLSPRDPASGQATGKRMHHAFVITKEIDQSSPLLYSALINNENITSWELQCFMPKRAGVEVNNYTVKLTNAKITDIGSIMLNNKETDNLKMPLMEEISFVYQRIEWIWVEGGISSSDDWASPLSKPAKPKK